MRLNVILRYMGMILLLNAGIMLLSALVSLANGTDTGFYPLLLSSLLTASLGAFPLIFVEKSDKISNKESFTIVVGSWLLSCVVGGFPYLLWGGEFDVINSWYESVSGYTSTGSSILTDVEALPKGLLFWRSSTHLIGGAGVVLFALVVVPAMGRTKMTVSSVAMEISAMAKDNYRYRTKKMIEVLLVVYLGMVVTQAVLLRTAGVEWFDAVTTSFSTTATGGFSIHNESMAYYDSMPVEIITICFMVLASIHFGLIFATLAGKGNNIFRSEVARYYIAGIVVASVLIAVSLRAGGYYDSLGASLRHSVFQTVSLASTTAYATADTTVWTSFAIAVLLAVGYFQGGMAGSTSGGIKADRILLAFKVIRAKIIQQQHPNAIIRIKLNGVTQDEDMISSAMLFIVVFVLLVIVGTVAVTAFGIDFATAGSSVLSCIGNIGSGFGAIGSMSNHGMLPEPVKFIETVYMLIGRLEIFGFIQLFMLKWWK